MYEAVNESKYFGIAQVDLSKAFDLVNHALIKNQKTNCINAMETL